MCPHLNCGQCLLMKIKVPWDSNKSQLSSQQHKGQKTANGREPCKGLLLFKAYFYYSEKKKFWLYSVDLMHFWYSLSVLFIVVQAHVRRSKLFCKLQMPWHIYAAPTDPFPVFILKSTPMRELLHKMKAGDWTRLYLSPVV